jgi:hypothetical protein
VKKVVYQNGFEHLVKPLQAAGPVQVGDITAVDIAILLQEVIGAEMPYYNLRNICRQITMNELKLTVPIYTKMGASNEKVAEMQEADVRTGDWSNIVFALWKNVAHIVISDEAKKRANIDVFGYQKTDCAIALARSEEAQIATELHANVTSVAGHDWGAMTAPINTNNPYIDIEGVVPTLQQAGFTGPYDLVAHPFTWADFWANTYVKGFLTGANYPDFSKIGGFPIPGLPGFMGYSSPWVTATEAYVLQKDKAIILGLGPTEAASYRNEPSGYDAYILRQWLQPQRTHTEASRRLTGVNA